MLRHRRAKMPERWKKALDPPKRKTHNYARDLLFVLLGLVVVLIFFGSRSRFDFHSNDYKGHADIKQKLVYDGELDPKKLGLPEAHFRPLERLLKRELPNLQQIRIHIERQDPYAKLQDDTELRYWFVITLKNGKRVRSVISRAPRKELVARLTRRLDDDLTRYREAAHKLGKERIDSFTNTM